jgi:hypothetical protein
MPMKKTDKPKTGQSCCMVCGRPSAAHTAEELAHGCKR